MTSNIASWSQVKLGNVLTYIDQLVGLDDEVEYTTITVKRRHGGLEAREKLFGSQIRTKKQFKLIPGAFIISRVQCWHQAYAIVPETIEPNMIASTNYDQFIISPDVDKHFFWWLSYSPIFTEIVRSCAFGVVIEKMVFNRNAWLDKTISIPPLLEQRRIVARIEELVTKIEEARGLRRETVEEVKILFTSAINEIWFDQSSWNVKAIKDLVTLVSGQIDPQIEPYSNLPHINGEAIESGTCRLLSYRVAKDDGVTSGKYHFKPGSILYSKIRPYLRKAVQVPVEGICSADVYAFESISPLLESRFFMYSLISPNFTDYANAISGRTRMPKLNQDQLLSFQMGYPPLSEQHRIVYYLDELSVKIGKLKRLQSEISAELDALIPSVLDKAFKGEL